MSFSDFATGFDIVKWIIGVLAVLVVLRLCFLVQQRKAERKTALVMTNAATDSAAPQMTGVTVVSHADEKEKEAHQHSAAPLSPPAPVYQP
ncbi:hypothetical protein RI367_008412 [Sorochytrium milnesiophthora]